MLKTAKNFRSAIRLVNDLNPINQAVNVGLEVISPKGAESLKKLNEKLRNKFPWYKAISSEKIDTCWYQGRSIVAGRRTPKHADPNGPAGEVVCIYCLGRHRGRDGAALYIESLDMVIPFPPGTFIYLRGGELYHQILDWGKGQRYSITHFTHQ